MVRPDSALFARSFSTGNRAVGLNNCLQQANNGDEGGSKMLVNPDGSTSISVCAEPDKTEFCAGLLEQVSHREQRYGNDVLSGHRSLSRAQHWDVGFVIEHFEELNRSGLVELQTNQERTDFSLRLTAFGRNVVRGSN
jgi:hypothetical protein